MPWPRRGDGSRTSGLVARISSQKLPSVNRWESGTSGSSPLLRSCRRALLQRLSRVRRRQTLPLAVLPGRCSTLGPHKSKASGYMWPNAFCEPVSVVCRTGLRHVETEIEKSRAETGAANGPNLRAEFRELPARDSTYQANPREYRRFLLTRKSKRRDSTPWLRMQSDSNPSLRSNSRLSGKITGNFANRTAYRQSAGVK